MHGLARGLTSKQIARALGGISPRTVQKHRENAMRRLGVRGMSALMRIAPHPRGGENGET